MTGSDGNATLPNTTVRDLTVPIVLTVGTAVKRFQQVLSRVADGERKCHTRSLIYMVYKVR